MATILAKGIDVSEHQRKIDWNQVKAAGIDFAIIRTGYGDTLANPGQIDKYFFENMDGARRAGVDVGVYHFSYAKDAAAAKKEAQCVLSLIMGYSLTYPVCFDYEYDSDRIAGTPGREKLTAMAKSFLSEVENAGYYAMLYSNRDFCQNRFDQSLLSRYDLWLADYNSGEPWRSCGLRQSSSTGRVQGISGNVDLDVAYKDYPNLVCNGQTAAPSKPQPDGFSPVKKAQGYLNSQGANLTIDGLLGPLSLKAAVRFLQKALNNEYSAALDLDGLWGPMTQAAIRTLYQGSQGEAVAALQTLLYLHGYEPNGIDGIFGSGCSAAVRSFQKNKGLAVDGMAGKLTFAALCRG